MQIKYFLASALLVTLTVPGFAQDAPKTTGVQGSDTAAKAEPSEPVDEGSTIDKASHLIGFNTIFRLKSQGADYNFEKILEGMKAANEGKESGMDREEQRSVLRSYQQMIRAKIQEKRKAEAETNRVEGEKAFVDFAKQDGAKELEDGIMYMAMKEGDGAIPEAADLVKLNYVGTYVNGEKFDSSIDKGKPLENGVLQFVPGFSSALQKMKVGSKWKVLIRGDKAYGMNPRPPMELNKTLMFEIELLEILEPK